MRKGKRCGMDGTREKDEDSHCHECTRYAAAVNAGRIVGIDRRKSKQAGESRMHFETDNLKELKD